MAKSPAAYKQNRFLQLRGFCYAAQTGSMSKAAEKLLLSQPSVSLQIKALERELDTQLFDRKGPRIALTADGQHLLELARPLVDGIDRLEDTFASLRDSEERGTVNVAAGGSTIQYILPPFVEQYTREYPRVDLRLHNVTGKAGLASLRNGESDFAVGPMLDTPHDIAFQPLFSYEPMLIACVDHPLTRRKRISLKDICKYPLILPPQNQSTYRFVESVFTEHSLDYDVKLEVGGYDVIKKYVQLGLGISIVMSHCLSDTDELWTTSVSRWFSKRSYGIVLMLGKPLSPAAARFIQIMGAQATARSRRSKRDGQRRTP